MMITALRFLSSMDSHVSFQIPLISEELLADSTAEWFLSRMNSFEKKSHAKA